MGTEEERVHNRGEAFDDLLLSSSFSDTFRSINPVKMDTQVSKGPSQRINVRINGPFLIQQKQHVVTLQATC